MGIGTLGSEARLAPFGACTDVCLCWHCRIRCPAAMGLRSSHSIRNVTAGSSLRCPPRQIRIRHTSHHHTCFHRVHSQFMGVRYKLATSISHLLRVVNESNGNKVIVNGFNWVFLGTFVINPYIVIPNQRRCWIMKHS